MMPVGLAAFSATAYGISDYLGGVASRRAPALRVIGVSYPLSVLLVAVVALATGGSPTLTGLMWGAASGVGAGVVVLLAAWAARQALCPDRRMLLAGAPAVAASGLAVLRLHLPGASRGTPRG